MQAFIGERFAFARGNNYLPGMSDVLIPDAPAGARPIGRPTDYRPQYARQAYEIGLLGGKDTDLARVFGVNIDTIYEWKKVHPEFSEATKAASILADSEIASSLYHKARGHEHKVRKVFLPAGATEPIIAEYLEYFPPDTTAAIFWLKNRQPQWWRDYKSVDLSVTTQHSISPETLDLLHSVMDVLTDDSESASAIIDATPNAIDDKK